MPLLIPSILQFRRSLVQIRFLESVQAARRSSRPVSVTSAAVRCPVGAPRAPRIRTAHKSTHCCVVAPPAVDQEIGPTVVEELASARTDGGENLSFTVIDN